jgi:hypothetical protein
MINVLHRAAELDVHVTINANQAAFVLCLAPFEAYNNFFVNSVITCFVSGKSVRFWREEVGYEARWWGLVFGYVQVLQHGPRVDGHDLYGECQCGLEKEVVILTLMVGSVEELSTKSQRGGIQAA